MGDSDTIVRGEAVSQSSLSPATTTPTAGLSLKNILCGIVGFPAGQPGTQPFTGIRGNSASAWQAFVFQINAGMPVSQSCVSLSLLGISNVSGATNMNYTFRNIITSHNGSTVTVTGEVLIGDSDGYLSQLGYTCFVA